MATGRISLGGHLRKHSKRTSQDHDKEIERTEPTDTKVPRVLRAVRHPMAVAWTMRRPLRPHTRVGQWPVPSAFELGSKSLATRTWTYYCDYSYCGNSAISSKYH